ncbi:MAG: S-layer homology domain-containing protein, partial [Oscillospiraceae bacterium]|nr:S-layer homology domain-containing protein [Oscillospiraceae bacterium]
YVPGSSVAAGSYEVSVTVNEAYSADDPETDASASYTVVNGIVTVTDEQQSVEKLTPVAVLDSSLRYSVTTSNTTLGDVTPTGTATYTDSEGNTVEVPGTWAWELDDDTVITRGTAYTWVFTPDDTDTYESVTGTVVLRRSSSSGGSSGGSSSTSTGTGTGTGTDTGSTTTGTETIFTDVASSAYYADAVAWAVENGVTNGTSDTTFSPEKSITRAEVVTFLWRLAGTPEPTITSAFEDLDSAAFYYDAVLWACETGVTNGTSETTFSPDDIVSRAQIVTLINRYSGETAENAETPFTDVDADSYYAAAVAWAYEVGVTNGTSENTFAPEQTCTRAQVVTFLYRAFAG